MYIDNVNNITQLIATGAREYARQDLLLTNYVLNFIKVILDQFKPELVV